MRSKAHSHIYMIALASELTRVAEPLDVSSFGEVVPELPSACDSAIRGGYAAANHVPEHRARAIILVAVPFFVHFSLKCRKKRGRCSIFR